MKVLSPGLALSTALTVATLTLTAPLTWAQDSLFGAYDPRQQETLWNEAITLQNMGLHSEAIEKLKRAAHLSRINDGLNARSQLPFIRAEIRSYRAANQLEVADNRQAYLSRLEASVLLSGPEKISALLAQAEWHQFALLANIDDKEESASRMARAWNFYRKALDESVAVYGESVEELIPALEGMVRAHYLLAAHRGVGAAMPGQMIQQSQSASPQRGLFKRGLSVFVAMQQLKRDKLGVSREEQAEDLILMGDWAWWTGNRLNAISFYQDALSLANGESLGETEETPSVSELETFDEENSELDGDTAATPPSDSLKIEAPNAEHTDAIAQVAASTTTGPQDRSEAASSSGLVVETPGDGARQLGNTTAASSTSLYPTFRLLDTPVALPAVPGFDPVLDIKQGEAAAGDLVVSFNISATGKAVNLERIQFPVVKGKRGPERVLRRLKKMRFRPVFEDGIPVESETITWVFEPRHWAMPGPERAEAST